SLGRARLWRAREGAAAVLLDDKIDVKFGGGACSYDVAAAGQIRETHTDVGVAPLRERGEGRGLRGSYEWVIDRCREREQVVVKRTGSEIDVLLRQVLLHACENISLCGRCVKAQQYQNYRSEADGNEE